MITLPDAKGIIISNEMKNNYNAYNIDESSEPTCATWARYVAYTNDLKDVRPVLSFKGDKGIYL